MLALDNLCTTEYHDSDNKAPESHNTAFSNSLRRYTIMNSKFSFLHQMLNVSALLLDDALLKCVVFVTEVVLFSIVAFKTLTFHKVV